MVRRARASRRGHSVVEYVGVKVQHSGGRVGEALGDKDKGKTKDREHARSGE